MATNFSPTGLGQTVAMFDKSGKAVSTGKHILNVFKEAKAAYQERKAEILAAKEASSRNVAAPRIRRAYTIDERSVSSSQRSDQSRHTHRDIRHGDRPRCNGSEIERRHSDSRPRREGNVRPNVTRIDTTTSSQTRSLASPSARTPTTPLPPYSARVPIPKPITRNRTFHEESTSSPGIMPSPRRTQSSDGIDMDLAYGEPPADLMLGGKRHDEAELNGLVGRAKFLLDEAKCVQHSVQATLANLKKNPEAMAAVALTLGEISTLVKRMSPGALSKVRVIAPSVFALLTSPQFLIAVGVGVGVTVIALGGYKIIKKLQGKADEQTPEQMIALGSEVSSIESWRQGIAEADTGSDGTSVDGEFITPMAANLSRLNLAEARAGSRHTSGTRSKTKSGSKSVKTPRNQSSQASGSIDTASSAGSSTVKEGRSGKDKRALVLRPKHSPLRSLFGP